MISDGMIYMEIVSEKVKVELVIIFGRLRGKVICRNWKIGDVLREVVVFGRW